MNPLAAALALAALGVGRHGPTAAQWVEALKIVARAERSQGHSLEVAFIPGGTARITEHSLKVQPA